MGSNSLIDHVEGTAITADASINPFKSALIENNFPRNNDGNVEDSAGSLGTDSLKWLDAFIASGFWNAGDIKAHHTYNGLADIGQGWYPCDGTIINESNYDSIHGAGSWANYIISSVFDGKYTPDVANKYLVGASTTTQDGSTQISATGNTSHQIDLNHLHLSENHNHNIYIPIGSSSTNGIQLDTTGDVGSSFDSNGDTLSPLGNAAIIDVQLNTGNEQQLFTSSLDSNQSIQPETIELIYYMRIV